MMAGERSVEMTRIQSVVLLSCLTLAGCTPPERAPEGPSSRHAVHEGRQVHYVDAGEGETTLLLVHGWASDQRVWRAQLLPLAERYRVLAVDLPGHGSSEEPAGEYSMDLFAAAMAAVLDDAGVERAVLVGHSNGVPSVRQFYRRYPERTAALVLVDAALKAMFGEEQATGFLAIFGGDDYRDRVAAMVDGMPAFELTAQQRLEIRGMATEQSQAAVVGGLQATLDKAVWEPDPITAPVLNLLAAQPAWTEEYAAFVRELAPQVDYRVWEDVSHFLMIEHPERFNDTVAEFVDGLP
jgi:pimeloyl-ACP methyl ester carboxylesterase